jgi:diadenosine tetraphosphate (Ap4A) HIT family hydrolase
MHIHIIARSPADPAWPDTVWSFSGKLAYAEEEVARIGESARRCLVL